ncbi:SIR2 family protein [Paenibacillus hodogayensis]|uniref:SIR2 family protein n=1 Tax=Paenibacillus hodogayensis TaxID=279208 RepID=A0ABV5VZZ9_9BACL
MHIPERLFLALKTGRVVLFIGAGANYHCITNSGEKMPTGNRLAEMLSEKFQVRKANLAETAELVEASHNRPAMNTFIIEMMTGAIPSPGFSLISSFKWSGIFTTNYDLLVEDTYRLSSNVQSLKVYYSSTQQMDLGPNDVPLYKLHGCISRADTTEGRLVITPDDYADYRRNRARLFNRLADLLYDRPFLYLGYGRQDTNFRDILADVFEEMKGQVPEGFALFPGKLPEDDLVWRKKNITLIDGDVDEFLKEIDRRVPNRSVSHIQQYNFPILKQYEKISSDLLQELLSYFHLPIPKYGETSNPGKFYKGSEADWSDLFHKVDAERDVFDPMMINLIEDALSIEHQTTSYTLLAEAGSGKSTILRRMAFDLCHDFVQIVFWYRGDRRIRFETIESIYKETGSRIFIFVDRASKFLGNLESLRKDCTYAKVPLTLVIADRPNEWNYSGGGSFRYTRSWTLSRLSDNEIENIIVKLEKFNCLGNLSDLRKEDRIRRFKEYSDRQLLVALREATEGKKFDELVVDEYESIPDQEARQAYLHVCFMHSFGKGIRTSALARSLEINIVDIAPIFQDLDSLIDFKDDIVTARHAMIARIIFNSIAELTRIDILDQLIRRLDLGYISDNHIFRSLMSNEDLIDSLGGIETRRRLFDSLRIINPNEAYLDQHEARMEIRSIHEGGSLERAERLIRHALKQTNHNANSIRHTAGLLYKQRAVITTGYEKKANLSKAIQEFIELTKRAPQDDYVWVSLIETRVLLGNSNESQDEKLIEYTRAEADYQKALTNCGVTPHLYRAKGRIEAAIGHGEDAREFYKKAITGSAPPAELFSNYINWELRHKNIPAARDASASAIELYKSHPDIMVLHAKSMILGPGWTLPDVVPYLLEAQRIGAGYHKLESHFWHAVALWESGRYADAINEFKVTKELAFSMGRTDIKHIRYISGMNNLVHTNYSGSVIEKGPRNAWIICNPGGAKVFINPKQIPERLSSFSIKVGFNRLGPVAIVDNEIEEFNADSIV